MSEKTVKKDCGPVAGFKVGVIVLSTRHPLLPGNVQHAGSFSFPVIYELVDVPFPKLMAGDKSCDEPIKRAVRNLERNGVNIIVGACGSFANWQAQVTAYAKVPSFISIMTQVPFILTGLPDSQKLGVLFANSNAYTPRVRTQCRISDADTDRLVILDGREIPGFTAFFDQTNKLPGCQLEKDVVNYLFSIKEKYPEIGAWLFQCSDLPPYAAAVQMATGLPVFDMTVLIDHLYHVVTQSPYAN